LHDRSEVRRVGNGSTKPFFKRRKIYVALNRFRGKESYAIVSRIKFAGVRPGSKANPGHGSCQSAEENADRRRKEEVDDNAGQEKRDRSRNFVGFLSVSEF
jgi:hypothetical protein